MVTYKGSYHGRASTINMSVLQAISIKEILKFNNKDTVLSSASQ